MRALVIALILFALCWPAVASDAKCRKLEAMAQAAIERRIPLTPREERLKVRLLAWYMANCRGR